MKRSETSVPLDAVVICEVNMELTTTMKMAAEYARQHGGKLHRHPGGFWAGPEYKSHYATSFGTSTVDGMVKRGAAEYTAWKEGRNGRFPVEVTLSI